jgi:hypothetical protein
MRQPKIINYSFSQVIQICEDRACNRPLFHNFTNASRSIVNASGMFGRFRAAMLVFKGHADALMYPHLQNNENDDV